MGEFAIGQGVLRFEDPRLVQGRGRYIDDVVYPAWLSASCCARRTATQKILSIKTDAARARRV